MRWSYQSTASSSSISEDTARCRSMVSGRSALALSCKDSLDMVNDALELSGTSNQYA